MRELFNDLPDTWEVQPLSAFIAHLESGVSVNADDRTVESDELGVLSTSCAALGRFMPEEHKAVWPKDVKRVRVNPRAGEIIISRMNTPNLVGETGFVKRTEPGLFLPDRLWQTVARASKKTDFGWLNQVLQWEPIRKAVRDMATGTSNSMKNISKGSFLSVQVPTPPLSEQRGIAEVLSALDEQIEQTEAVVAKSGAVLLGIRDALLKPLLARTQTTIGAKLETYAGGTPYRGVASFFGGDIPWVKSAECNNAEIWNTDEKITKAAMSGSAARWVPHNTVLIAMYGATAGVVSYLKIKATTNQAVLAVLASDEYSSRFLYHWLIWNNEKLLFLAQGSGQPNLNKAMIAGLNLPILSYLEQCTITEALDAQQSLIAAEEELLLKLRLQKQGLMRDLLTGATRIQ